MGLGMNMTALFRWVDPENESPATIGRLTGSIFKSLVVEFAKVSHALTERAHQGFAPSAWLEAQRLLVEFKIGSGVELHVTGFRRCKLSHGDAGFDLALGVLLLDGKEVQPGECFGGVLLNQLPFVHAV